MNNGNLLIYTDKQNEAPQLFQLKLEADTIRQIVLETYDSNQNSASTETLTQIIDKVQKEYPADSYGLVLWSHGTGWLPSDIYSYLRSFGQDGKNNFMEINDLASALSKYHLIFYFVRRLLYMSCRGSLRFPGMRGLYYRLANGDIGERLPYQSIMGDMFKKEADVVGIATKFLYVLSK